MKVSGSQPSGGKTKLKFHHTEVHQGDNGGIAVNHYFSPEDGDGYPQTKVTNNFGPTEGGKAMSEIGKYIPKANVTSLKKDDASVLKKAKVKVGHAIKSLSSAGSQNKIEKVR